MAPPDIPIPVVRTGDGFSPSQLKQAATRSYYVYTTRYDEIAYATELLGDSGQFVTLQNHISRSSDAIRRAHRNYLDKLSTTFSGSGLPIAATVLMDNSGSLRGAKVISLASWAMVLMEWFERLGVDSEFLGFTTRAWKGGRSRELWLNDGKPANPGRLNDLRHIIYKSFEDTATVVAPNCRIMARDALIKENVDGEALLWAYERLMQQKHSTKLLFIISDGAPVDDSTLSVNRGAFLSDHLKNVSDWLSAQPGIKFKAVGIEQDLSRYYLDAVTASVDSIGIPILKAVESHLLGQ